MLTAPAHDHALIPSRARALVAVMAVVAMVLATILVLPAHAQQTGDGVTPARVGGQTRFHTAANIATLTFDQADVAHIVFAGDYPDALTASYAAGAVGGPILPVPADEVGENSPTMTALRELGVQRTVLVGGEQVLSESVEQELRDAGFQVDRIAGATRYETASSVATTYGQAVGVGTLEGDRTALLASGVSFADALAAGPVAARGPYPLLLTPSDQADASVDQALQQLDIGRIVVVGGPDAVSGSVVRYYQDRGYEVERWHGETRQGTATTVADNARLRLGFGVALTLLARGDAFPDALTASVHGAVTAAPILLTATPETLGGETRQWLAQRCPAIEAIRAIGSTAAVDEATLAAAVDGAEACQAGTGRTQQSYIQSPQEAQTGQPGDTFDITVVGFEEPDNPAPVDIALFPCDVAAPTDPNDNTFADADGDGHADGIGTTDSGRAVISSVHGAPTDTTHLDAVNPDANNRIHYTISSPAEDCVVNTVFHDANDNDQLDVDDQGRPLEHWNFGRVAWSA